MSEFVTPQTLLAVIGILGSLATAFAVSARSTAKSREITAQAQAETQRQLNETMTAIQTERSVLQSKVIEQANRIGDLQAEVATSKGRYDILQAQIETLRAQMGEMQAKLNLAETREQAAIDRAEREEIRANELAKQLTAKQTEIAKLEAALQTEIARRAEMQETIDRMECRLGDLEKAEKKRTTDTLTPVVDDVQNSLQEEKTNE